MPMSYRRPGVYLEESLLVNPSEVGSTVTVAAFVGVTSKGPINEPQLVESWSDFVTMFGSFDLITPPAAADPNDITTVALGAQSFNNLTALQGDGTLGNGKYPGAPFTAGQYVKLEDASKAHFALPALTTNRRTAANGQRFAADPDITASDATNAAKLTGTNEVQTLTPSGTISAGTFVLNVLGVNTAAIAYNATSTAIKAAIDTAIAGNAITVAGGPINTTPVTLTFTGYGDIPQVTVTPSLTGTNPLITPSTTTPGTGEGFIATPTSAWAAGDRMWIGGWSFRWDGAAWVAGGDPYNNAGQWTTGAFPGTGTPLPAPTTVLSYLPYSVFSFFQNGGRFAWVVRAAPTATEDRGLQASATVNGLATGLDPLRAFKINAKSVGVWGNNLKYGLVTQSTVGTGASAQDVFAIQVLQVNADGVDEIVETFTSMTMTGDVAGTRRVDSVINDPYAGSRYIQVAEMNPLQMQPDDTAAAGVALTGGVDPKIPDGGALGASADLISKVEGPINLNICGYMKDSTKVDTPDAQNSYVSATVPSSNFPDREDIFIVNDSAPPRLPQQDSAAYASVIQSYLGAYMGDSYVASYGPWIIIPNPGRIGTTVTVPPGGAIMGMMARIDATIGVFRAPAGVIAGLSNAVGVQTKFTDTQLGDLNSRNINIARSVVGAGVCVMGGRTRKTYGADRYVSARRTLIFLKETLRRSTQWAVFENNDNRLWSGLRLTADRILRPLWEQGGLRGRTAAEAYFIACDESTNPPSVIQSGEVRMEVGVALEYPAEFVIIRITQYDRGSFTAEVQAPA